MRLSRLPLIGLLLLGACAAAPTVDTSDWSTFRSQDVGVSLAYPPEHTHHWQLGEAIDYEGELIAIEGFGIGDGQPEGQAVVVYRSQDDRLADYVTRYHPLGETVAIDGVEWRRYQLGGLGDVYGYLTERDGRLYLFESMWGPENPVSEAMLRTLRFE